MTELVLNTEKIDAAISEYIGRCSVILIEVFFARDELGNFRAWAERRFQKGDALVLLHEAPLDMVCRYLGRRPSKLTATETERATKVALEKGWVAT